MSYWPLQQCSWRIKNAYCSTIDFNKLVILFMCLIYGNAGKVASCLLDGKISIWKLYNEGELSCRFFQISKINMQPSRIMYMVEGKHPRNNSLDVGDKHFKISFPQTSYEHEEGNYQQHPLKLTLCIYWRLTFSVTHSA